MRSPRKFDVKRPREPLHETGYTTYCRRPEMMTPRKENPKEGRVDYRWRVDRDGGFEKATLIYDREGRLIAVDYQMPVREQRRTDRTDQ